MKTAAGRRPTARATWWTDERPGKTVVGIVKDMRQRQTWRIDTWKAWCKVYGEDVAHGRITEDSVYQVNILANLIDTLHAQIYKTRVLPTPVTFGGNGEQQLRARNLGRFNEGLLESWNYFYDHQLKLGLYALCVGHGWFKESVSERGVHAHVIEPWNVYVDELEAQAGDPRCYYEVDHYDRYTLLEDFGSEQREGDVGTPDERAQAIEGASCDLLDVQGYVPADDGTDRVPVIECWRLPSHPEAQDGCHVITLLDGTELVKEPWDIPMAPLLPLYAFPGLTGIFGQSAVHKILPGQRELDELSAKLQKAHAMVGVPRIVAFKNSGISLQHISDTFGSIVMVDQPGLEPREWQAAAVHPQLYDYRETVKREMAERLGVSLYAAQSQIPAGLKQASGIALQRFEDVESVRQAVPTRMLELFMRKQFELTMYMAEKAEKLNPKLAVTVAGKKFADRVKWSDVKMDRDSYVLRIATTSWLAKSPAARYEQAKDMRERQDITAAEFFQLVSGDNPDIEAMVDRVAGPIEAIQMSLDKIVYEGVLIGPEPTTPLAEAKRRAAMTIEQYKLQDDADEERLAMLREYLQQVVDLEQQAAGGMNAGSSGSAGPGGPGLPPTGIGLPPVGGDPGVGLPPGAGPGVPAA